MRRATAWPPATDDTLQWGGMEAWASRRQREVGTLTNGGVAAAERAERGRRTVRGEEGLFLVSSADFDEGCRKVAQKALGAHELGPEPVEQVHDEALDVRPVGVLTRDTAASRSSPPAPSVSARCCGPVGGRRGSHAPGLSSA